MDRIVGTGFKFEPLAKAVASRTAPAAAPQALGITRGGGSPVGPHQGMLRRGNIDLSKRPSVKMPDGSIATVRSMSFNIDGKEVLLPTVSPQGKLLSGREAVQLYRRTGQHLGMFDTPDNATAYAQALHQAQDKFYTPQQGGQ